MDESESLGGERRPGGRGSAQTVVRKARSGELSDDDRDRILDEVWYEFDAFAHVYHTAPVLHRAHRVARRYGLRGAGAVHLASALWLTDNLPGGVEALTMIIADRELAEAAADAGLPVFDPTREALPEET